MRTSLSGDDAQKLNQLKDDAEQSRSAEAGREVKISASAWVRGAVQVAADDKDVADRIAEAAPETRATGHGGRRPGAGRPPGRQRNQQQEETTDDTAHEQ